jgi:hypothetical protein
MPTLVSPTHGTQSLGLLLPQTERVTNLREIKLAVNLEKSGRIHRYPRAGLPPMCGPLGYKAESRAPPFLPSHLSFLNHRCGSSGSMLPLPVRVVCRRGRRVPDQGCTVVVDMGCT